MHGRTLQWCKVQKVVGVRELCHTHCDVKWLVFCSKLPFKFHVLLDVKLSVRTELVDLPTAASTAPAFEPPLLALSGPTAVLNPGETSCPACETPRLAAKTKRKKRDKLTLLTCRHELHIKVLRHFWGLSTGVGGSTKDRSVCVSYWLLLAEEKTAKLRIGSRVWKPQYRTLRWGLSTLCNLVGWSTIDWWLLVCWYSCSQCHL